MRVVYFKAGQHTVEDAVSVMDIEDKLETYYDLIGCDSIEITTLHFIDCDVNVVVDEEGLFKDKPIPSILTQAGEYAIVGNAVITGGVDEKGDLTSLRDHEITQILMSICKVQNNPRPGVDTAPYFCLMQE